MSRIFLQLARTCLVVLLFCSARQAINAQNVMIEAEAFDDLGGWFVDQQFMDIMGSPFLLAHGMGTPVADAHTEVVFERPGTYRVWVRTRDWVATWNAPEAPGRFQLLVDQEPLEATFGTEGEPWHWQDGGTIEVQRQIELRLHDLTGFEGRCDAVLFSPDLKWHPPDDGPELARLRSKLTGVGREPRDAGSFDLVVTGGGIAGTAAAVSAARQGLSVCLIQDRPVLGGNSSSEVRVWPEGHVNQQPWPRVGDLVMELIPDRQANSKNAQDADVFDDQRKLDIVNAEENITLLLEHRVNHVTVLETSIQSVRCQHTRSGQRVIVGGRWFLDSTGDGVVGFLAGADFDQTDKGHMGASNLWNIRCLCQDEDPLTSEIERACEQASFPRCPWAVDLSDKPFPGRLDGPRDVVPDSTGQPVSLGNWFWESGFDLDPVEDMERIRDQNFRAAYGAWDAIKNVEKRYPAHKLNWVAFIAGKRESRRLLGDVVLSADDLRDNVQWEDGCFPCTWGIDTHFPRPEYAKGHAPEDAFIAGYTHGERYTYQGPYWAPYRCLYSRNIDNLFMAGRDISVTHEGLGAVRVMKTCGAMGEIVGMAAAICKQYDCSPKEVGQRYLAELQRRMKRGVGKRTKHTANDQGQLVLQASAAALGGKMVRFEAQKNCLGYWRHAGDSAEWLIETEAAGTFEVIVEYACEPGQQGGSFTVSTDSNDAQVEHEVLATNSWEDFRSRRIGMISLSQGQHNLALTNRKDEGPLMKSRTVWLKPVSKDPR